MPKSGGAGDAGEMLVREIDRSLMLNYEVVGFVDDDPRKQGRRIHGIEVVGTLDWLPDHCRALAVQDLLIAIPTATGEQKHRILARCRESGVPFKSVPPRNELLQGRAGIGHLREVRPEDLLGREAVRLDVDPLRQELSGKRVLVTGAGGSIGSELCRQILPFAPASCSCWTTTDPDSTVWEFGSFDSAQDRFRILRLRSGQVWDLIFRNSKFAIE